MQATLHIKLTPPQDLTPQHYSGPGNSGCLTLHHQHPSSPRDASGYPCGLNSSAPPRHPYNDQHTQGLTSSANGDLAQYRVDRPVLHSLQNELLSPRNDILDQHITSENPWAQPPHMQLSEDTTEHRAEGTFCICHFCQDTHMLTQETPPANDILDQHAHHINTWAQSPHMQPSEDTIEHRAEGTSYIDHFWQDTHMSTQETPPANDILDQHAHHINTWAQPPHMQLWEDNTKHRAEGTSCNSHLWQVRHMSTQETSSSAPLQSVEAPHAVNTSENGTPHLIRGKKKSSFCTCGKRTDDGFEELSGGKDRDHMFSVSLLDGSQAQVSYNTCDSFLRDVFHLKREEKNRCPMMCPRSSAQDWKNLIRHWREHHLKFRRKSSGTSAGARRTGGKRCTT